MTGLDPETHLTIDEAAVALGVHRRTVYRYISNGVLARFRHARRTYIHRNQIDEYFARLQARGDAERARNEKRARR